MDLKAAACKRALAALGESLAAFPAANAAWTAPARPGLGQPYKKSSNKNKIMIVIVIFLTITIIMI